MFAWGGPRIAVVGLLVFAACGEAEKAKTSAQEAVVQELVASTLDDDSTFTGKVYDSPLALKTFTGKVSVITFAKSRTLGQKIEIKSGTSTLDLAPDAVNTLQGVAIQIYRWTDETEMPVVNPKEPPADGAFAVVAYSEIKRDNLSPDGNRDWYTYRSTEGTVKLEVVDVGDNGGVKGTVDFSVILLDPNQPPKVLEELPVVRFVGKFNVRKSEASQLVTGK